MTFRVQPEPEPPDVVAGLLGVLTERYKPRLATIACNTASTIALGMVREVLAIPIVGTVPAIKTAAALTRTGTMGLLGTQATIRQGYVDWLEAEFAGGKQLIRHAAPALVAAAEAKLRGDRVDRSSIEGAVAGPCANHANIGVSPCSSRTSGSAPWRSSHSICAGSAGDSPSRSRPPSSCADTSGSSRCN